MSGSIGENLSSDHPSSDHPSEEQVPQGHPRQSPDDHPRPSVSRPSVSWWALVSSGLSPVLLILSWAIAEIFQPSTYSPVRQTVSTLSSHAATDPWIVTSALFVVGALHFVTAAGLNGVRRPGRIMLVVAGFSAIGIAAAPQPVHGASPAHIISTAVGEVVIATWPAFIARRKEPGYPILEARRMAWVTTVSLVLFGWLVFETMDGTTLGLAERLASGVQTSWPFVIAVALWYTDRRVSHGRPLRLSRGGRGPLSQDPLSQGSLNRGRLNRALRVRPRLGRDRLRA